MEQSMNIPKKISFFWAGKMSWMRYLTLYSFRKYHPNWEIFLYTSNSFGDIQWNSGEVDDRNYRGDDYWKKLSRLNVQILKYDCSIKNLPPAQICDIFQWDILSTKGGYYADMDILFLDTIPEIEADVIFCFESGHFAIGFFGAKENCKLFQDIYAYSVNGGDKRKYQGYGSNILYRIFRQADIKLIRKLYPKLKIMRLPDVAFYRFDWRYIPQIFQANHIFSGTIGLHWFGGSILAQEWNDKLTPNNWQQYENTFTSCLKQVFA
jgi:hypothetical protein